MEKLLAIFRPRGLGTRLTDAANKYLKDWVFDPDEFVDDHELSEFERRMIEDFIAGLFGDEQFAAILQECARGMKAGGMDPEGPDHPRFSTSQPTDHG